MIRKKKKLSLDPTDTVFIALAIVFNKVYCISVVLA